ncbi:MAG: histidine--tRNA ligase [Pyrinomonadaceae bacterium]|nr:histidine--tRNA ligase [Pyrinomonadaceae bacterium]MCX7640707.1 histidine--tRNA ligase [Pyrinomonadaceae bacterium]MDW8305325.1 histidine--tRNA ligase [Acidobacteriota bacterium]
MSERIQPARGTRDFLPEDIRRREYVVRIIREVYESYGFEPLETPAIENLETLLGKYGEEGNQLIFKILKRGEKLREALQAEEIKENELADLALRYDLTVPFARVIANYSDKLPKFFKRYQIQPVWRADRPAHGRFREFYQCDLDAIGSRSPLVEAEIFQVIRDVLEKLGFSDFEIRLNHREVLREVVARVGIPQEKQLDAIIAIDKLDKVGYEGVLLEMLKKGISNASAERLLGFLRSCSQKEDNVEILASVKDFIGEKGEGLKNLEEILKLNDVEQLKLDVSLARGLDYYTGAIMEVSVGDLKSSIGGGGRYDNLIGMFSRTPIPACGFSLGLERILVVMQQRRLFPDDATTSNIDVMVTVWSEHLMKQSLQLASELRSQGVRVLVYPQIDKLGKQLRYASQIGARLVCILGENEIAEGKVSIKNLLTGIQEIVNRDELKEKLAV